MDSLSLKILKLYSKRRCLNLEQLGAILNIDYFGLSEPVWNLRKLGYLRIESNHAALNNLDGDSRLSPNTPLEITFNGSAVLEAEHNLTKAQRNEWIRYAITTAIAIAAFIKSFFF